MSELVEKVAAAIRPTLWDSKDAARAAITAVAEWLDEHSTSYGPGNLLRKRLEQPK